MYEETRTGTANLSYISYYSLGGKLVGMRSVNQPAQNGQYRIVGDHLGSTSLLIDTSNPPHVVQRTHYKPYGEVAWQTGSSRTNIGFTGQRLDSETGLMYYGARFYDPVLSYFISADPTTPDASNPVDYNKYLYVRGNPLRYIDSLGYGPEDYYIFVQGCISTMSCDRHNPSDWGEYGKELEDMYNNEGWGYGEEIYQHTSFKSWSSTHVRYVGAKNLGDGAQGIRDTIGSITDKQPGVDIHLLGHSMGGAAIAAYILDAAAGNGADSRVKSAVMIDAPLVAYIDGPLFSSGLLFGSRINGLGAAAAKLGINAISIDTPNDWVSSPPTHGVPEVANPTYPKGHGLPMPDHPNPDRTEFPPGEGQDAWHTHTSLHMATQTKAFLDVVWR